MTRSEVIAENLTKVIAIFQKQRPLPGPEHVFGRTLGSRYRPLRIKVEGGRRERNVMEIGNRKSGFGLRLRTHSLKAHEQGSGRRPALTVIC